MGTVNLKSRGPRTYEGGAAIKVNAEQELRRAVMCCLLWENQFYENGIDIAERIAKLCEQVSTEFISRLAVEAKQDMKLRHVPLWLAVALAKRKALKSAVVVSVVTRADDLTELLSLYWKDGKKPLSAQLKKGLAKAFSKFDEYQLAKYDRAKAIKLRDVIRLTHPKPKDDEQKALWGRLVKGELATPDTWEVQLSAGKDKKETFTRLIQERKLGALALLRNLRNMIQSGVDLAVIKAGLAEAKKDKIMPYQFIAAARFAPMLEPQLESAMLECVKGHEKISGKTILLVDVSGSMDSALSDKSDMQRLDAACGLAVLLRELCEDVRIFTFSNAVVEVPLRQGFALRDAVLRSQAHSGTYLGGAIEAVRQFEQDRIIVLTDEQSADRVNNPRAKGYMVNVASYQKSVGFGDWTRVSGWSEGVIRYIMQVEK